MKKITLLALLIAFINCSDWVDVKTDTTIVSEITVNPILELLH